MVKIYKEEYAQTFESKQKAWRQKYAHKNLKNLNYQTDQSQQLDQSIPLWVQMSEDEFNSIKV